MFQIPQLSHTESIILCQVKLYFLKDVHFMYTVLFFFFTICGTLLVTLYIYIGINDQDYTKMDKLRYALLCGQLKVFFFKGNLDF